MSRTILRSLFHSGQRGLLAWGVVLTAACQPAGPPVTEGPAPGASPPASPGPVPSAALPVVPGMGPTVAPPADPAVAATAWPMHRILDQAAIQAISQGQGAWPSGIAATPDGFWFTSRNPGRVYRYENGVLIGSRALDQNVGLEGATVSGTAVVFTDVDRCLLWRWQRGSEPVALNQAPPAFGIDRLSASTGDGGRLQNAQLDTPLAVAAGTDGTLVISEAGSGRVRRVDTQGLVSTIADGLTVPAGVAVGADGAVAIADTGGGRVLRWTASAGLQTLADALPAPAGIAVAATGTIWLTDGRPFELLSLRPDGTQRVYHLNDVADPGPISISSRLLVIDRATNTIWEGDIPDF